MADESTPMMEQPQSVPVAPQQLPPSDQPQLVPMMSPSGAIYYQPMPAGSVQQLQPSQPPVFVNVRNPNGQMMLMDQNQFDLPEEPSEVRKG